MNTKSNSAKKQILLTLTAFFIGVIITRFFYDSKTASLPNKTVLEEKVDDELVEETPVKNKKISSQNLTTENHLSVKQQNTDIQNIQAIQQSDNLALENENPKPRRIELMLDEQTVGQLERNINDLSIKVTIRRENEGWRVNYMTPDNLMAVTGIQNNDLILFDLIETAKSDPTNKSLVTRLENIFSTLER